MIVIVIVMVIVIVIVVVRVTVTVIVIVIVILQCTAYKRTRPVNHQEMLSRCNKPKHMQEQVLM